MDVLEPSLKSDLPFVIKAIKFKNSKSFVDLNVNQCDTVPFHVDVVPHIEQHNVNHDDNSNDEYEMYCKVEKHMKISADLYSINKHTKNVIEDLIKYKGYNVKQLIGYLKDIVNDSRVSSDLYTRLINALDETLFNECGAIEAFYVIDVSYNLEALYYKQDTWVDDVSISDNRGFAFDETEMMSMNEAMYLLMFLGKWKSILHQVLEVSETPKLHLACNRYLQKVCICTDYVISLIHQEDDCDRELVSFFMCQNNSKKKLKLTE
jgi:hypothetical protein